MAFLTKEELTGDTLSIEQGIKNCGGEKLYQQVAEEFVILARKNIAELTAFCDTGDVENYTIKIHAMKNTARLIGATTLEQLASELEEMGNRGRMTHIRANHKELVEVYFKVVDKLEHKADTERKIKDPISIEQLTEMLEVLQEFASANDLNSVDSVLQEIDNYMLPDNLIDPMRKVKIAIYEVNQMQIRRAVQEMLELMNP